MGLAAPVGEQAALWPLACPDWIERLKSGRSLVPDLPTDADGDKAVGIFNKLKLPDVPGMPALAEAAGDWFRDIVRSAFGSIDPETGRRRVAEIFALVPKKNSKTTGGAGIMITALLMNKRPKAEMLFVGPTQEIASLAFDQAKGMIENDEEGYLQKRFHIRDHLKAIEDRVNGAVLKVKTFDMKVMTGAKPVVVLLDELHIMSTNSYARSVVGQIRGGLIANPESLLIIITTQSDQPPAGVFKAELQYARGVRDGTVLESRMLPILYEFPEAMQTDPAKPWRDPRHWPMVLPNLGLSITLDRLQGEYRNALEKGDEEERRWVSQHLNVEIGMALHTDRWRGADYWLGAADDTLTFETLLERSEVVVAGIDGGGLDDLFGLALIGRCKVTKDWLLWGRAWAQTDVLERRKEIAERLMDFERAGDLVICPPDDPTMDVRDVAAIIKRVKDAGLLPEKNGVGLDPAGIAATLEALAGVGVEGEQVIGIAQGYRLTGAVWGLERKLKDGTLWHGGQGLMAWAVGNAKAVQRGNAVVVDKETSGKAKIDPLMAAFDAVKLMERNPEAKPPSVYRARGLLSV